MKVGSTEASVIQLIKAQDMGAADKSIQPAPQTKDNVKLSEVKSISQMTPVEKQELPISERVVIDAIERANKAISISNRKFEYSIHEKTKEIMVKVIDSDTNEIIREIPPEKILDLVAKMWEMAGLIVDERR
jgi:flagellar protein FlaG